MQILALSRKQSGFKSFNTVARSIENHYQTILSYFDKRITNVSAESFNRATERSKSKLLGVSLEASETLNSSFAA
jgi:transposase